MVSLGDYEENIGQEGWYNKDRREEGRGREVGVEMEEVGDKEEVLKKRRGDRTTVEGRGGRGFDDGREEDEMKDGRGGEKGES